MSRQYLTCPHCFQPIPDNRMFCRAYRDHYRDLLHRVPDLLRELDVTLSKQDRISTGNVGGSRPKGHEKPLVYKVSASAAHKAISDVIANDARMAREFFTRMLEASPDHRDEFEAALPADPRQQLIFMSERMANYEWFDSTVARLDDVFNVGMSTIDVAEGQLEAGVCECGTRVRGSLDSPTYTCSGCGLVGGIVERQQQLWDAAMDVTVHPALAEAYLGFFIRLEVLRKAEGLPGVLAAFEEETSSGLKYRTPRGGLISLWSTRGHLHPVGRYVEKGVTTEDGWLLFRFGDIVDLAEAQLRKADERKAAGVARRSRSVTRRKAIQEAEAA